MYPWNWWFLGWLFVLSSSQSLIYFLLRKIIPYEVIYWQWPHFLILQVDAGLSSDCPTPISWCLKGLQLIWIKFSHSLCRWICWELITHFSPEMRYSFATLKLNDLNLGGKHLTSSFSGLLLLLKSLEFLPGLITHSSRRHLRSPRKRRPTHKGRKWLKRKL